MRLPKLPDIKPIISEEDVNQRIKKLEIENGILFLKFQLNQPIFIEEKIKRLSILLWLNTILKHEL